MRFAQPLWLLLILPAGLIMAIGWLRHEARRAALSYPSLGELRAKDLSEGAWIRRVPRALKALALLLGLIALARPQRILHEAAADAWGIDILLALDTSTSMKALDFDPLDRMGAAKAAAKRFISGRVSDRIGLTVFGGQPILSCPLTTDYDALQELLDDVYPGMTNSEGTAIGDGIASAVNHLKDSPSKSKVIILLTDGRNNAGLIDPWTAAKTAQTYGIKIYTIGTGQRGTALYPVDDPLFGRRLVQMPDDLDEDLLLKIAAETEGRYFRATNLDQLIAIYRDIDRMEKVELGQPPLLSYADLHLYLLWPAALLLAAELLLGSTWLLRLP